VRYSHITPNRMVAFIGSLVALASSIPRSYGIGEDVDGLIALAGFSRGGGGGRIFFGGPFFFFWASFSFHLPPGGGGCRIYLDPRLRPRGALDPDLVLIGYG